MKKVLYISYDGLTDPLGQSQILPYLKELTKQGFAFTILSFEKPGRLQKEKEVVQTIVDGASIEWHPLRFTSKPPVLSKIWDRYQLSQTVIRLHKEKKFDLVHCRSYVAAEMGLHLKRKFGIPMIFDMRGFWADEKVDNGQWNLSSPLFKRIYSHYKLKERSFLLEADGIVSLTEAAKEYLIAKEEYKHLSITVIPTCADLAHFNYKAVTPQQTQELRNALGLKPTDKVMTYLGSVGGWYLTGAMFRFFLLLRKEQPEYKMLVLTKDPAGKVMEEATALGIPKDSLVVTYSDRRLLPLYLSLSTCSVFFIRDTFSKKASSPTKHAELMGMGIPVIANSIGDTGQIITETGTGVLVDVFDDSHFNRAIEDIPALLEVAKGKIRQAAVSRFDLSKGVASYLGLYKKILG